MRIELFELYRDENIDEIRSSDKYEFYQFHYFQFLVNQQRIIETLKIDILKILTDTNRGPDWKIELLAVYDLYVGTDKEFKYLLNE